MSGSTYQSESGQSYSYYGYISQPRRHGEKMVISNLPKLSCCCVTKDRPDFLRIAIKSFLAQCWPNKEMIVLTDGGGTEEFERIATQFESDTIHFFAVKGTFPLGHLRNMSLDQVRGDIYVQWDDDDFSAHNRLPIQLAYMLQDQRDYCCLSDQLHIFMEPDAVKVFYNDWGAPIPGTIMARVSALRRDGIRYPENMGRAEDVEFFKNMDKAVLSGFGHMYAYIYHGDVQGHANTFDYNHHRWLRDHRSLDAQAIEPFVERIENTMLQFDDLGFGELRKGRPLELWARTSKIGPILPRGPEV